MYLYFLIFLIYYKMLKKTTKKKIYYGAKREIDKTLRRPTESEAFKAHQVRYWGLHQIRDHIDKEIDKYKNIVIEKEEKEEKKPRNMFSYNLEWKKEIELLYKSTRKTNTKEFKDRQDILLQLQKEYDLFPTPEILTKKIIDDFMKTYNINDVYNILEPSLGLGSLLFSFIDNQNKISINKIDGIEFSKKLYDIMKEKISISNYYNNDFLEFKQERPYNLILMNPPYRGYVYDNIKNISEKEIYWYHIIKALLLNYGNYDKTIYLICPKIHKNLDSNNMFEPTINKSLERRITKYFNIDYDEEETYLINSLGNIQFTFLTESKNEFKIYNKSGGTKTLSFTVCLYKIVQCCSNTKIIIE